MCFFVLIRKFPQNSFYVAYSNHFEQTHKPGSNICSQPKIGTVISCPRLRCIKCDHLVLRAKGYIWNDKIANYLFFRLNMPDTQKLKKALIKKLNAACYCCQCQYISIHKESQNCFIDWHCSGHSFN